MLKPTLYHFINRVLKRHEVTCDDVRLLQRDILPDGMTCREEVDMLIALDRVALHRCKTWESYLVSEVMNFVVWMERPTGHVTDEAASWLTASLSAGSGPTRAARLIVLETRCNAISASTVLDGFHQRGLGSCDAVSGKIVSNPFFLL